MLMINFEIAAGLTTTGLKLNYARGRLDGRASSTSLLGADFAFGWDLALALAFAKASCAAPLARGLRAWLLPAGILDSFGRMGLAAAIMLGVVGCAGIFFKQPPHSPKLLFNHDWFLKTVHFFKRMWGKYRHWSKFNYNFSNPKPNLFLASCGIPGPKLPPPCAVGTIGKL